MRACAGLAAIAWRPTAASCKIDCCDSRITVEAAVGHLRGHGYLFVLLSTFSKYRAPFRHLLEGLIWHALPSSARTSAGLAARFALRAFVT
jgi:hypothetical protein